MHSLQSSLQGSTVTLGIDLYPRWVGSQAALQGNSPYSPDTRRQIWLAIYGSSETPHGNPFGFYYPPAIVTLLAPFILAGFSLTTSAALWCALIWALLSLFLMLWITTLPNPGKARLIIPLLLISGWLFRPAFSNYVLGQFALFSVLMLMAAWMAFEEDKPVLAGIFCALSLTKPSLTILPVGLLFIFNYKKAAGITTFLISSLILYLPPTWMLGWWFPAFLQDLSKYTTENEVSWSAVDVKSAAGLLWFGGSILLTAIGIRGRDKPLALASILALNAIFVPHTADYDLVALLPLLVYISYSWLDANRNGTVLTVMYFLLLWLPWLSLILFLIGLQGSSHIVEAWYRFIWLTYPDLILFSILFTKRSFIKPLFRQTHSDMNSNQAL